MSSRTRVIQSATITLLLFGQCCWSLWIRSPTITAESVPFDRFNNNLLTGNELSNGQEPIARDQENVLRNFHHQRQVVPDGILSQAGRFLEDNVESLVIHSVTNNLRNLLQNNAAESDLPIVYQVNDEEKDIRMKGDDEESDEFDQQTNMAFDDLDGTNNNVDIDEDLFQYELDENGEVQLTKSKRSGRYYRRYPFKRRNDRYYDNPKYNCKPSKEEVVKLLIALHKYQAGNKTSKKIKFCKRDRPIGNIITNIRFLG